MKGVSDYMRKILVALGIIALGAMWAVSDSLATDIPDEITMNSKIYEKHRKSLVTWGHSEHADDFALDCTECHHIFKGGENVWKEGDPVKKCDACHKDPKKPRGKGLTKAQKVGSYYWAIHKKCRGCHQEQGSGPIACNHCHPRQKSRWSFTWR
jgi:hypothetical protein